MNKRLPKNDYELGWNDAFHALVELSILTNTFWPMSANQMNKLYRKFIQMAEKKSVEIVNIDKEDLVTVRMYEYNGRLLRDSEEK